MLYRGDPAEAVECQFSNNAEFAGRAFILSRIYTTGPNPIKYGLINISRNDYLYKKKTK